MSDLRKILLLIETSREYGRGLLRGIIKYARISGSWALYTESGDKNRTLPPLQDLRPDGIILRESRFFKKIIDLRVPTIICLDLTERIPDFPNLSTDQISIGTMGAEYFLHRKFRVFAYAGYKDMWWSLARGKYFAQRTAEAGFNTFRYEPEHLHGRLSWIKTQSQMIDWLRSLPKPIGIMACNDDYGRSVVESCKMAGLHIPDEVAVLGVDNDEMVCELTEPPLSSIALNTEKAGYEAGQLLDKLIAGQEKMTDQHLIVPATHIVTRRSTDVMAIDDTSVIEAIHFINSHARDQISIQDIMDAVFLSRSTLERRFRRCIGYSILQEIKHVRIEHITQLLLDTNMSVSQIAGAMHFTNIEHLSRYFRQGTGMSPTAYRNKYGLK